ncbi:hypothetical protein R3P38DRAFT_3170087 [Favolaschia claudopus]|uniref:DUF6534 domain-containing protein n=1 Tax=Favolaschia claudopus TaxID=2862362 RepID=A0AAW0DWW8_9AGAR
MIVENSLNISDVNFWYAISFGDDASFAQRRYSKYYTSISGSLVATTAHIFFFWRIIHIRRDIWPLCIPIILIAIAEFAGGLGVGIISSLEDRTQHQFDANDIVDLHDLPHAVCFYLWLVCGAVADILIAIVMMILLSKTATHDSTRAVTNNIICFVFETNLFSATAAVLTIILFVVLRDDLYYLIPLFPLTAIYANTLLAMFNNRAIILHQRRSQALKNDTFVSESNEIPPRKAPARQHRADNHSSLSVVPESEATTV